MLKKGVVLSCVLVFLTAGIASAYRPLTTENAGVAGKGVARTEVSWDNIKWKNADKEDIFLLVPIYGLTENLELSVEIPYLYHKPSSGASEEGIGDINIVAKYLLVPGGTESPAFAVKGVVKMDNGDYDRGLEAGIKTIQSLPHYRRPLDNLQVMPRSDIHGPGIRRIKDWI